MPSLCSSSAPPRSSVSLRREGVYKFDALAVVFAVQRTHLDSLALITNSACVYRFNSIVTKK